MRRSGCFASKRSRGYDPLITALKVAFLGTPQAAVPSLEALIRSPHEIVGVVTAPDRPQGRGMKLDAPPVKKTAHAAGLRVVQLPTLKTPEAQEALRRLGAEIFVVVAYGFILPKQVLEIPRCGCINLHFSLLPKLRGAAPVQWALIEGHPATGITIMQLDEGMDTGAILSQAEEPITPDDTVDSLETRLAVKGAERLVDVIGRMESGQIQPQPQDDPAATYAPKISGEDAHIDWSKPSDAVVNLVRGLTPRPGAWGMLNGKRIKFWKMVPAPDDFAVPDPEPRGPGVIHVDSGSLFVAAGSGRVVVEEVQPEGKSRMAAGDFIRGYRPSTGDRIL